MGNADISVTAASVPTDQQAQSEGFELYDAAKIGCLIRGSRFGERDGRAFGDLDGLPVTVRNDVAVGSHPLEMVLNFSFLSAVVTEDE